jgi:hypothetical protein
MPSSNPFYVGYYPGDPIPRTPRSGGGKYIPKNYDYDEITKWINEIDFSATNFPDVVKNEIVADIKRQLRLSSRPQTASYDVQKALMFGDIEETPGVQLELNLNPKDWADDPEKEAKKTAERWKKAIFHWTDIRNWAEERYFWEPILAGRDQLDPEGQVPLLGFEEKVALKYMGHDSPYSTGLKPFQLEDIGIEKPAVWLEKFDVDAIDRNLAAGHSAKIYPHDTAAIQAGAEVSFISGTGRQDVYDAAAGSFLKFTHEAEGTARRNFSFNTFRLEAAEAVRTELNQHFGELDSQGDFKKVYLDDNGSQKIRTGGFGVVQYDPALDPELVQEVRNFSAAVDVATVMNTVRAGPSGKEGLAKAISGLSALQLEGARAVNTDTMELITGQSVVGDLKKTVKVARENLGYARGTIGNHSASLKGFDENYLIKKFNKKLDTIEELVNKYQDQDLSSKFVLGNFKAELEGVSNSIAKSGYIKKGLMHDMLQGLAEDGIVRKKSFFAGKGRLGEAFEQAAAARFSEGKNSGLDNISRVVRAAGRMYDKNDVQDLLSTVEGGKVFQVYFWPVIRTRLNGFTPAAQLGEALQKRHYFGLHYNQDKMEQNLREKGYLLSQAGTPSRAGYQKNLSSLDNYARLAPENRFRLNFKDGAGKVVNTAWVAGGKHFIGAKSIYGQLVTISDPANKTLGLLGARLDKGKLVGFDDGGTKLIEVLNGDLNLSISGLAANNKEAVNDLKRSVFRFRLWLNANKDRFGLEFDSKGMLVKGSAQNEKILLQIFQQLGHRLDSNDYMNILWERAGYLQYLSAFANQIQSRVVRVLGRFISPYVQMKNAISTAFAEASYKFVTGLMAAFTGGTGLALSAFLDKLIKPVIKFIVNTVINKTEAFFKAVLKGDVGAFTAGLEKTVTSFSKIALYIAIAPLAIIIFLIFMFMTMLGSLPAVDPTLSGGFHSGYDPGTGPPGSGYAGCSEEAMGPYANPAPIPEYVFGNNRCFEFVNPTPGNTTVYGCGTQYTLQEWNHDLIMRFGTAIEALAAVQGGNFINRLCQGGTIRLYKAVDTPGWCGCAGVAGGGIVYTSTCSYQRQSYLNYLFAHEAGHIYNGRLGWLGYAQHTAGEPTLPTYPGVCGSQNSASEDFAEIIGNWVQVNVCNCADAANYGQNWATWWDSFPRRRDFSSGILFN